MTDGFNRATGDVTPPLRPISFVYMRFLVDFLSNNRLLPPPPPVGLAPFPWLCICFTSSPWKFLMQIGSIWISYGSKEGDKVSTCSHPMENYGRRNLNSGSLIVNGNTYFVLWHVTHKMVYAPGFVSWERHPSTAKALTARTQSIIYLWQGKLFVNFERIFTNVQCIPKLPYMRTLVGEQ